jgi:hypothetical protein
VPASEAVHSDLGCSFLAAHHFSLPGSALQAPSSRLPQYVSWIFPVGKAELQARLLQLLTKLAS